MNASPHCWRLVSNDLRLKGKLCDAVIKVEDIEFKIHKIILVNLSPYFRALFLRCALSEQKVFNIPGISAPIMELILEYAYTGLVSVTSENIQELLLTADQLEVMDIVQICWNFIENELAPKNCIGIWQFTNIVSCPEMRYKACRYITDHFVDVVSSEEFLQLSVEELEDILGRDELCVRQENSVYEAAIKWMLHMPEEREEHAVRLLSKVRLGLMTDSYIRLNVLSQDLVCNNLDCLSLVCEALQTGICSPFRRPRLPNSILLAIGGWSGPNSTNGIEAYDFEANHWRDLTNSLKCLRTHHGAVFLNGFVYCVGGFDRVHYFNSVCRFDLGTHIWEEVAPMYSFRIYVSVTVLNGCIYALGGYNGCICLNTAECYRPKSNQWSFIAPMHEQRSFASCTTLHHRIYICGGVSRHEYLQTAECYNPETNQWTMIAPMASRRSGIGVVAYQDRVYAIGGFNGDIHLNSAEAYNPFTNSWHAVPSMSTPRSKFGIEVINDSIFVVGGFNGNTAISDVEFYNAVTNEWFNARQMNSSRSALSCCVVFGLNNLEKYTIPREALPLEYHSIYNSRKSVYVSVCLFVMIIGLCVCVKIFLSVWVS
ncbi:kelch-like protein 10 [Pholidichthys leucotaenia]